MTPFFKFKKTHLTLMLKGFAMGVADIVPGVSGGTIAFITGIYDELVESISQVNKVFVKLLFQLKLKHALQHIHFDFLLPLLIGIFAAIISVAGIMHYLLQAHPVQIWSLFFGLIGASILYIGKQIKDVKKNKHIMTLLIGSLIGYGTVSLIPVNTANDFLNIFAAGAIAICAMILPGISGSFILLILGKYAFITGALKQPFIENHLMVIAVFSMGCLVGLLSFSKILNWLLKHFHNMMMCFLTGFMIGSMKKIWPWKEVVESKIIRGKTYVLQETNTLPTQYDIGFWLAVCLVLVGFFLVIVLEKISKK